MKKILCLTLVLLMIFGLVACGGDGNKGGSNGDSVFQQGDTVVVVTNGREVIKQFNDIFA